jgi:hypothetical protein
MKNISNITIITIAVFLCVMCFVLSVVDLTTKAEYLRAQTDSVIFGLSGILVFLIRIRKMTIAWRIFSIAVILLTVFSVFESIRAIYGY